MVLSREVHVIVGEGLLVGCPLEPLVLGAPKQVEGVPPHLALRDGVPASPSPVAQAPVPIGKTRSPSGSPRSPASSAGSVPVPIRPLDSAEPGADVVQTHLLDERRPISETITIVV